MTMRCVKHQIPATLAQKRGAIVNCAAAQPSLLAQFELPEQDLDVVVARAS